MFSFGRLDKDTPLEVKADGEALIIRPQRRRSRSAQLRQAVERMAAAHDETLKKLADQASKKSERGR
jgi:virulence-associated protein VagC